jgi:hypothetical protein
VVDDANPRPKVGDVAAYDLPSRGCFGLPSVYVDGLPGRRIILDRPAHALDRLLRAVAGCPHTLGRSDRRDSREHQGVGLTTPALVGEDGGLIAGHARILAARLCHFLYICGGAGTFAAAD